MGFRVFSYLVLQNLTTVPAVDLDNLNVTSQTLTSDQSVASGMTRPEISCDYLIQGSESLCLFSTLLSDGREHTDH